MHANRPRGLPNRSEPQFQVLRNRRQPTPPSLGLACGYGNEAPIQINLAPIKPVQFRCPQARERTQGEVWAQSCIGFVEEAGNLFRREDRNGRFLFLVPHHARKWTGTLEEMPMSFRPITASARHPPHVVLGRRPELEAAEPFIERRRGEVTQAEAGEGFRQLPRELPAQWGERPDCSRDWANCSDISLSGNRGTSARLCRRKNSTASRRVALPSFANACACSSTATGRA
jgi:hypothetical protein